MFTYSFLSDSSLIQHIVISGQFLTLYARPKNQAKLAQLVAAYLKKHPLIPGGFLHTDLLSFNRHPDQLSGLTIKFYKPNRVQNLQAICDFFLTPEEEMETLLGQFSLFLNKHNLSFYIDEVTRFAEVLDASIEGNEDANDLLDFYLEVFRLQEALLGIQHTNRLYWYWRARNSIAAITKSRHAARFKFNAKVRDIAYFVEAGFQEIMSTDLMILSIVVGMGYAYLGNIDPSTLLKIAFSATVSYQAVQPLARGLNNLYRFFSGYVARSIELNYAKSVQPQTKPLISNNCK